jgi:hypothetical protein
MLLFWPVKKAGTGEDGAARGGTASAPLVSFPPLHQRLLQPHLQVDVVLEDAGGRTATIRPARSMASSTTSRRPTMSWYVLETKTR